MKDYWSKWWLRGWMVILFVAWCYELTAFVLELDGIRNFPTLSSILVALIPLPLLEALTIIIALLLMWHWWDLTNRNSP